MSGASGGMKPGFRDLKWGDGPGPQMEVLDEHAEAKVVDASACPK